MYGGLNLEVWFWRMGGCGHRSILTQLEKHEKAIKHIQAKEKAVKQDYQACLERYETAESARQTLEVEYKRMQEVLRKQERLVGELERGVAEERQRRGEEGRRLEELLGQEQERRHKEVITSSQLISELKDELRTKVSSS